MKLVVRMISIFFIMKIFGLSGFFNPDLRLYRIKSAFFTSPNPHFSVRPRCFLLKSAWLVPRKNQLLSDATRKCSRSPTNI